MSDSPVLDHPSPATPTFAAIQRGAPPNRFYSGTRRVLIFGTSYVSGQPARYIFGQWRDLVTRLNPDADTLAVDSASPDLPDAGRVRVLQLGDNIGHLGKTGRDGWGRAFCAGLQAALDGGYDHVVHIETDLLFRNPVTSTLEKMARSGVKIAAPVAHPYLFMETALMFASVAYIRETDLIRRYDWENIRPPELPEARLEGLTSPDLFLLPLKGCRNDMGEVAAHKVPEWMDWITHADPGVCRGFLKVNGYG